MIKYHRSVLLLIIPCIAVVSLVSTLSLGYSSQSNLDPEQPLVLQEVSRAVTVRIPGEYDWGSGILIQRRGDEYLVVTNDHVLNLDQSSYKVQTPDGIIHPAQRLDYSQLADYDLAILSFTALEKEYQIANLGDSDTLHPGELVIAVGFPFAKDDNNFSYTEGKISLILPKSLEDGYQIGYTNYIQKGMSGGPVLNAQGQVIAINGVHANPLWEETYLYADGEALDASLQKVIQDYSWAIPINTLLKLLPNLPTAN